MGKIQMTLKNVEMIVFGSEQSANATKLPLNYPTGYIKKSKNPVSQKLMGFVVLFRTNIGH
jgi:hypothetical protein